MKNLDKKQQKQLQEIKNWALENGNQISYITLLDLLKYERQPIINDEAAINQIVRELVEQGIRVEPLDEGETYQAQADERDGFVPALVDITSLTQNVSTLMERLFNEEIDLSPAFQNYLIGERKTTESGESILVKRKFEGLQYLQDFNGKTFDELPRQYIRRIKEAQVIIFGVQKGTPENVVYNIFERINTGGLKLEPQEIRNAMYHGKASELAKKLAEGKEFLDATLYAVKPKRMADQEYVIRFMAFTELDYQTEYKDDIDHFLILTMKKINDYSDKDLKRIEKNFMKVMRYSKDIFEKNAFRKVGDGGRRGPINKALFELFSVCFSELKEEQLDKIVNNRAEFLKRYGKLFQEKDFISALRSGKRTDCIRRINKGRELIKEFI